MLDDTLREFRAPELCRSINVCAAIAPYEEDEAHGRATEVPEDREQVYGPRELVGTEDRHGELKQSEHES